MSEILNNEQWIYVKRPTGRVSEEHYRYQQSEIDTNLSQNEVLVEAKYISVDPYMRIQQHERNTYDVPHPLFTVQAGGVVGQVVASNAAGYQIGDWVLNYQGWQRYAKCHMNDLQKLDPEQAAPSTALGVLGMPGRTAWFGLMEAGRPRPGDTVVVSGAAGAVGSLVAQFAKRAGCRVIGIAGGAKKCAFLIDKLKLDAAIDYQQFPNQESMSAEILRVTEGVDVYFDNVGGMITDALIPHIKLRARIVICGTISQYDGGLDHPDLAPRFLQHMLFKRASIQGILARDFTHRMPELRAQISAWVRNHEIVFEETIIEGFSQLPSALSSLFEGKNIGKLLVKI